MGTWHWKFKVSMQMPILPRVTTHYAGATHASRVGTTTVKVLSCRVLDAAGPITKIATSQQSSQATLMHGCAVFATEQTPNCVPSARNLSHKQNPAIRGAWQTMSLSNVCTANTGVSGLRHHDDDTSLGGTKLAIRRRCIHYRSWISSAALAPARSPTAKDSPLCPHLQ